jgi:hypothetical protein
MEDNMIKYSIFLAVVFGTSVAAYATIAPESALQPDARTTTVIHKNEVWPVVAPLVVETCDVEDCSDTPQS